MAKPIKVPAPYGTDAVKKVAKKAYKKAKKIHTAVIDHAMKTGRKARKATERQFKNRGKAKQHKADF